MKVTQADKDKFLGMCLCPNCPSWMKCDEKVCFCLVTGKSKCIKKEKGCMCGACPVKKEQGLKHWYYCIKGFESEQSKAKAQP